MLLNLHNFFKIKKILKQFLVAIKKKIVTKNHFQWRQIIITERTFSDSL